MSVCITMVRMSAVSDLVCWPAPVTGRVSYGVVATSVFGWAANAAWWWMSFCSLRHGSEDSVGGKMLGPKLCLQKLCLTCHTCLLVLKLQNTPPNGQWTIWLVLLPTCDESARYWQPKWALVAGWSTGFPFIFSPSLWWSHGLQTPSVGCYSEIILHHLVDQFSFFIDKWTMYEFVFFMTKVTTSTLAGPLARMPHFPSPQPITLSDDPLFLACRSVSHHLCYHCPAVVTVFYSIGIIHNFASSVKCHMIPIASPLRVPPLASTLLAIAFCSLATFTVGRV